MNGLTTEDLDKIARYTAYLDEFKSKAIEKFTKGCLEHHDQDFWNLDFDKEIQNEIIDLISYSWGRSVKKGLTCGDGRCTME